MGIKPHRVHLRIEGKAYAKVGAAHPPRRARWLGACCFCPLTRLLLKLLVEIYCPASVGICLNGLAFAAPKMLSGCLIDAGIAVRVVCFGHILKQGGEMQVGIDMGAVAGSGSASAAALGGGKQAMLDLEELLATRLLVQGNSGSGKSHLLRRLLEQSAQWVQQCIVDPEGDFVTLADLRAHVVVDAARTEAELTRIAGRIRQHRVSVVLNLEGLDVEQQMRSAAAFLGGLFDADREYWYPVLVVVDEAQMFAPAAAGEVSDEARKLSLGAMTNLMCRGRKRGLAGVIATQRLAKLAKNVAAEASNFLMGRTFLDIDMARAADLLGMDRRQAEMFRDLQRGNFVALGPALSRRPLPIVIGAVETSARSSSPKLMPLPDAPEDALDLIFTPAPQEIRTVVRRTPPPPPPPIHGGNSGTGGQAQARGRARGSAAFPRYRGSGTRRASR
ncbi:hypothetical protein Ddc_23413 [Ditylenchus destructor]|nr:hypothetical protein Ddc_23413 [Ditylenchus destructor]